MAQLGCEDSGSVEIFGVLVIRSRLKAVEYATQSILAIEKPDAVASICHTRFEYPPLRC
jgi:hypothetical protein